MKVIFIFCLMISTCLFNQTDISSNLRHYSNDKKCYVALQEEIYKSFYSTFIMFNSKSYYYILRISRAVPNLGDVLNAIIEQRIISDSSCQFVKDSCKDGLTKYISSYRKYSSAVLNLNFPKMKKYLGFLNHIVNDLIKDKCDLGIPDSSYKQRHQASEEILSNNLTSPIFKLNNDSDICEHDKSSLLLNFWHLNDSLALGGKELDYAVKSLKEAKYALSETQSSCINDFYDDCKKKYNDTKESQRKFWNYLSAKNYDKAREYTAKLTTSFLDSLTCGL